MSAHVMPVLMEAFTSRRLLPLIAALLHATAARSTALQQQEQLTAMLQGTAVEMAALQYQLYAGVEALFAVLGSCASGVQLLLGDAATLRALLDAAHGSSALSLQLRQQLVSWAATAQLCSASLDGKTTLAAADTAAHLLLASGPAGRKALQQALALQAHAIVPRLLQLLHTHCALLQLAGAGYGAAAAFSADMDVTMLLDYAPAACHAPDLLLALVTITHPGVLSMALPLAARVQQAAAVELQQLDQLPPEAVVAVEGMQRTKAVLSSICGAAEAAFSLRHGGVASLLAYLHGDLPVFGQPLGAGAEDGDTLSGGGDAKHANAEWLAAEAFFW
jgi:hypothetical protein